MPPAHKPPPDRPCIICGETFTPQNKRNVCCSPACQRARKLRCCVKWYRSHDEAHKAAVVQRRRERKKGGTVEE